MARCKILLTNFHAGTGGGHRTYIFSLLKSSLAGEFDLALACPATSSINSRARQSGERVFDLDFPGNGGAFSRAIAAVRKLEKIHRQFPFDIIHCNGSRDHWIALYWKTFYRRKTRIIRSRHAVKTTKNDFIHAWANRATELNIFVSRGMVPLCEPPGTLRMKGVKVIANGVDTDYFQPQKKDSLLSSRLGIGDLDFVIGSNAGLGTHKRVDLMMKALAGLPQRENVKLILLGEKRSAAVYLRLAGKLGLEKNVLYGGMLDDVRPCLSLFDLGFVLSESIETSSYAAKEMLAMGIPLICSRYSGLPENVDEGKNGFLIAPGNGSELQEKLAAFRDLTPGEREKFRIEARKKAVREFSLQTQIDALAEVYREVRDISPDPHRK